VSAISALRSSLKATGLKGLGLMRRLQGRPSRFHGAYPTYEEALAHVRRDKLAGYDNDGLSSVHEHLMERVSAPDYPVLYWLSRWLPQTRCVLDAGGHTGVKYRAFGSYLDLGGVEWVVFDVPAMVRAGRAKMTAHTGLRFVDDIKDAPAADLLLASGLLQYIRAPLADLVGSMRERPRFILINKVATREGAPVVTLENFGSADVPYQVRAAAETPAALKTLGYEIVDEWINPSLANEIYTHPELGRSISRGYAAVLRDAPHEARDSRTITG
jgi:putative methyltransferase (TIGR04325 family)